MATGDPQVAATPHWSEEKPDTWYEDLVGRYLVGDEDLDEAVHEAHHEVAADQVNDGECPELSFWDAYDELHDRAGKTASEINNSGPAGQLAYLARGCADERAFRELLEQLGLGQGKAGAA